jgi:hypothetical protein
MAVVRTIENGDVSHVAVELTLEDDGRPFGMGLALVAHIAGPLQYSRINSRNRTTLKIARRRTGDLGPGTGD